MPGTAIAHVDPAAFFIIGMEFRDGDGEPALAAPSLLRTRIRAAHSVIPAQRPTKNENGNQGDNAWPTAPSERRIH
jgi:hypothetical protein